MSHTHLSPNERYQIQAWLEQNLNKCQIAHRLGRHRSTIYRELARCAGAYDARSAQLHRADCARRCAANAPHYGPDVWHAVRNALQAAGLNPDSQAGKDAMRMMQGQQSKPAPAEPQPAGEKKN